MQKQPLLVMLLCFVAGIFCFETFPLQEKLALMLVLAAAVLVFSAFLQNLFFQKFKNIFLGVFFFCSGIFAHFMHSEKPVLSDFKGKQTVIFKLNKKLNSSEKYRRYEVSILNLKNNQFSIILSVPKADNQLDYNHLYRSRLYLNRVLPPNNDFQFNYAKYLSRKNIYYQAFANENVDFSEKTEFNFADKIRQCRLDVLSKIDKSSLQPRVREFLKGIILADRTEMDAETVSDFSKTGLVHLLAISGSHMVIIFWLVMLVLKNITPHRLRKFPVILSLILIWSFAVFIDYGSSVVRSCIMISAYYIAVLLNRKPDLLHAMALAGFFILIPDTHQLFDVGFQLSFVAVLGIFWLNEPILKLFGSIHNKILRFFAEIFSMSLSAQLATLPLVIYYFHQYSLISLLANLVIIPFAEIIIVFSVLMVILIAFGGSFRFIELVYDYFVDYLLKAIHWFSGVDWAFSKGIGISVAEVFILLSAAYFLRFVLVKKQSRHLLNFGYALLLFFALRLIINIVNFKKSETVMVQNFKQKTLIDTRNGQSVFYLNQNSDVQKAENYIISPYVSSRRIRNYKVVKIPEDVKQITIKNRNFRIN